MAEPAATGSALKRNEIDWQAELACHDGWLRSIVLARVGERQAVDDVMQEIALAAIRQQSPIKDPSKTGPWLYRLAVTKSLLYRRTMGRRRKLEQRYADRLETAQTDDHEPDPLRWLLADERRDRIREAITSLSSKDAEILLLKYVDGWSYKRLAELFDISNAAVESRLHRARARMRKRLLQMEVIELGS